MTRLPATSKWCDTISKLLREPLRSNPFVPPRGHAPGFQRGVNRRCDPMRSRSMLLTIAIFSGFIVCIAPLPSPRAHAAEQSPDVPAWLNAHVGEGEDQISQVVLQRGRALYLQKLREGAVKNPCYFAM